MFLFCKYTINKTVLQVFGKMWKFHWEKLGKMWETRPKTPGKMWKKRAKTLGKMWKFLEKRLEKCEECITFVAINDFI